jgi:hypothetical protein
MKLTTVVLGALVSLGSAHDHREGHAGLPRLVGARKFLSELKARNSLPDAFVERAELVEERQPIADEIPEVLEGRATGRCGPGLGTCSATQCCSSAG